MNINWLKNQKNITYTDIVEFALRFSREIRVEDLKRDIQDIKMNALIDGKTLKGKNRTSIRLFIPNLMFDEKLEQGDNVWIYMGESYGCYCLCGESKKPNQLKNYEFYNHKQCEYFPCHPFDDAENFNCLFCYCPLYALKDRCGGNFHYTASGIKDCSGCNLPHQRENYDDIMKKFGEILEVTRL